MVRSQELIDKLVADLHFHHYLSVDEGDNFFSDRNRGIEQIESMLERWGLNNKLDAHEDFYHGGQVVTERQIDYIYQFIDDVYIDYFFRTYNFHPIVFPKGLCYEQVTKDKVIHPETEVSLNLNDLYDRSTFVNNIYRLFGVNDTLLKWFPKNSFIKGFYINEKVFGLHSFCDILVNKIHFWKNFEGYLSKYYPGRAVIKPQFRGKEIMRYLDFLSKEFIPPVYEGCSYSYKTEIYNFEKGFSQIKDSHIFGEYTIEEILMIYALLIDKFDLNEDAFLLSLCMRHKIDNKILAAFVDFEESNQDYRLIEPYICSEDLYLRFASHLKSKAFQFTPINDTTTRVSLFNKEPVNLLHYGNTMPLPYLYRKLNK